MNPWPKPHPRRKFTSLEDAELVRAVSEIGADDWDAVAARLPGRNPRQCRERWSDYLSPNVRNGPWTPEEEAVLEAKYAELGPTWSRLAHFFYERTDINVRSHWQQMERRKRKSASPMDAGDAPQRPERIARKAANAAAVFDGIWRELGRNEEFIARVYENGLYQMG
jgi:hypothetical protein